VWSGRAQQGGDDQAPTTIPLHGVYTTPLAIPSRPQVIIPQLGTKVIVIPQLSPIDTDTKANPSPLVIIPSVDRTALPEHISRI
jgi:hypothetical protein